MHRSFWDGFCWTYAQVSSSLHVSNSSLCFRLLLMSIYRYVSMRRGAIILAVLSVAINPWRFLTQASIFITVLSTFAIFSSATSPILNADYWLVRKKAWKVPDLYHRDGIYWYTYGWNLRGLIAWSCAVLPSFREFAPGPSLSYDRKCNTNIFLLSWCYPQYHGRQIQTRR
jgi:NCS1 family nucleobase:cation symporter-1